MMKRTTRFRHKQATHIFLVMLSSEVRKKKPYALPVQCIPCAGLKESDLHRIVNELSREIVAQKMKVAGNFVFVIYHHIQHVHTGFTLPLLSFLPLPSPLALTHTRFVSNGEFNYLRTKGYTCPLAVLKVRTDMRNKYSHLRHSILLSMLTPKCETKLMPACTPISAHSHNTFSDGGWFPCE